MSKTAEGHVGSKFGCYINEDVSIRRLDGILDEDGEITNFLSYNTHMCGDDYIEEFQKMSDGLYEFANNGKERFDIKDGFAWIESAEADTHLLLTTALVDYSCLDGFEIGSKALFSYGMDDDMHADYDTGECSRCRGGGCPSCDTSGFFTGISVY